MTDRVATAKYPDHANQPALADTVTGALAEEASFAVRKRAGDSSGKLAPAACRAPKSCAG